jgi:hypothetical protein
MKFKFLFWRVLSVGVGTCLFLACASCAVAPIATLGTVVDIAGTAVSTGSSVFKDGKLDTALMADFVSLRQATRAAAWDLDLHFLRDQEVGKNGQNWEFEFEDDTGAKFHVSIRRRTDKLCFCQIDVGLFGSEPVARLMLSRIQAHLPAPTTRPRP